MGKPVVPRLIEVALVAKHIGWTTRKARTFLTKTGMAGKFEGWSETLVLRDVFAVQMPTIFKSFCEDYLAGKLQSNRGAHKKPHGNRRQDTARPDPASHRSR